MRTESAAAATAAMKGRMPVDRADHFGDADEHHLATGERLDPCESDRSQLIRRADDLQTAGREEGEREHHVDDPEGDEHAASFRRAGATPRSVSSRGFRRCRESIAPRIAARGITSRSASA
jgi:hypothetical protein